MLVQGTFEDSNVGALEKFVVHKLVRPYMYWYPLPPFFCHAYYLRIAKALNVRCRFRINFLSRSWFRISIRQVGTQNSLGFWDTWCLFSGCFFLWIFGTGRIS